MMANGKKASRDELRNLQENLGPYYQKPLSARRNASKDLSREFARSQSRTPDPKRQSATRQGPSSRDSTPNHQHSRSRSKSQGTKRPNTTRDSSTPIKSPRSEATPQTTPRQEVVKQEPKQEPLPEREMSQRNRSGRGLNRNNGNTHGEEAQIWEACKSQVSEIVTGINAENDSLGDLVSMDKQVGIMDTEKVPMDLLQQMEQLCRNGVKLSESNMANLRGLSEQLKILRAVVVAKEQAEAQAAGPGKRAPREPPASASSLYDFDAVGDSPVPSPIGVSSRKSGDRPINQDRSSMPPRTDSVEPQGSSQGVLSAAANARSKVVFSKGDSVAFKPRAGNGDHASDWILGEVAQVSGEGKSRRYKVLDIEPDDQSKQKEYRSSASNMIQIAPESQVSSLKDLDAGKTVLALYPNTTTFYKAEVHSMASDGRVNLQFEGENDSTTLQAVERRFVIEYRA